MKICASAEETKVCDLWLAFVPPLQHTLHFVSSCTVTLVAHNLKSDYGTAYGIALPTNFIPKPLKHLQPLELSKSHVLALEMHVWK